MLFSSTRYWDITIYQISLAFLAISIFQVRTTNSADDIIQLKKLWIYQDKLALAGHSSGASFAHTFHIIHSKLFIGMGMFQGLYYHSGKTDDSGAYEVNAENKWERDPELVFQSKEYLKKCEKAKLVDSLKNLKNQKVFIYAGTNERSLVIRMSNVVEIYAPYLKSSGNIITKIQYASHRMPMQSCKPGVEKPGEYDGACHYNGMYAFLQFVYGNQISPEIDTIQLQIESLQKFDQTEFIAGINGETSLEDFGYLYIPHACARRNKCKLLIFFHGCSGGSAVTGKNYGKELFEIAEVNKIILLLPRVKATAVNPGGCWDFTGYTGPNYATNKGPQVQAIREMIRAATGL